MKGVVDKAFIFVAAVFHSFWWKSAGGCFCSVRLFKEAGWCRPSAERGWICSESQIGAVKRGEWGDRVLAVSFFIVSFHYSMTSAQWSEACTLSHTENTIIMCLTGEMSTGQCEVSGDHAPKRPLVADIYLDEISQWLPNLLSSSLLLSRFIWILQQMCAGVSLFGRSSRTSPTGFRRVFKVLWSLGLSSLLASTFCKVRAGWCIPPTGM